MDKIFGDVVISVDLGSLLTSNTRFCDNNFDCVVDATTSL